VATRGKFGHPYSIIDASRQPLICKTPVINDLAPRRPNLYHFSKIVRMPMKTMDLIFALVQKSEARVRNPMKTMEYSLKE
jgi:hypothetical protein